MTTAYTNLTIDEYLRQRLTPAEGTLPRVSGIEMYGNSIPARTVGGDLFEYINFQQRYDIAARIQRALKLSQEFLDPLLSGAAPRNSVDDHVQWLKSRPGYKPEMETEYRDARSSEQSRVAEDLRELYDTAGVLLVDAEGHGIISAKIASTVHDTFHALMLSELDHRGKTTPELFERINLRLAQSRTARNALGVSEQEDAHEIASMIYGEVRPSGHFRFVNFGHPPPLLFCAATGKFMRVDRRRMVQFLPLGLHIPADHPDRSRYLSLEFGKESAKMSQIAEMVLNPGDILFLYTDGVYDGSGEQQRLLMESLLRERCQDSSKQICDALMEHALSKDETLRKRGDEKLIDDKTVFIIKRSKTNKTAPALPSTDCD
jgi:serine phosphatase RsbU (regulator of sigma subunit)